MLQSYWALILNAGCVNVSTSTALSVRLALPGRELRMLCTQPLLLSGFFCCSPVAQGELHSSGSCLLLRDTAPTQAGSLREG